MDELSTFCNELKKIIGESNNLDIESARKIVKSINEFLFTKYPDIGFTESEKKRDLQVTCTGARIGGHGADNGSWEPIWAFD